MTDQALETKVAVATHAGAVVTVPFYGTGFYVARAVGGPAAVATGVHATVITPGVHALEVTVPVATGLKARLFSGFEGDIPIVVSVRAQHQVAFSGIGFFVARALGAEAATADSAGAQLTVDSPDFSDTMEGFNVDRAVAVPLATATSATGDITVAYYDSAGFTVFRPITAKAATTTGARADVNTLLEGFRVTRTIRAKLPTGAKAKASGLGGITIGPGFVVARAMGAAHVRTATKAKASLGTVRRHTVKLPTATKAVAPMVRRLVRSVVRVPTAARAVAVPPLIDRPLAAKANTASSTKTAFLDISIPGLSDLGARAITTATGAVCTLEVTRPLGATLPTASSLRALVGRTERLHARLAVATGSWAGPLSRRQRRVVRLATATYLRASITTKPPTYIPLEGSAAIVTGAEVWLTRVVTPVVPLVPVAGGVLVFDVSTLETPEDADDLEEAIRAGPDGESRTRTLTSNRARVTMGV